MNAPNTAALLLVEDDPGHSLLIRKNLLRADPAYDIVTMEDGQKAVDYLFKRGPYEEDDHLPPAVILLDLNLPILSGYQVLSIIKNDELTKRMPVVVLTTTDNPQEIRRCYELGCNLYLTKPVEYDRFADMIQKLGRFLPIVKIPDKERPHG